MRSSVVSTKPWPRSKFICIGCVIIWSLSGRCPKLSAASKSLSTFSAILRSRRMSRPRRRINRSMPFFLLQRRAGRAAQRGGRLARHATGACPPRADGGGNARFDRRRAIGRRLCSVTEDLRSQLDFARPVWKRDSEAKIPLEIPGSINHQPNQNWRGGPVSGRFARSPTGHRAASRVWRTGSKVL